MAITKCYSLNVFGDRETLVGLSRLVGSFHYTEKKQMIFLLKHWKAIALIVGVLAI